MRLKFSLERLKAVRLKRLAVAASVAVFLLAADYFCANLSYPLFDTSSRLLVHSYLYDHDKGEESDADLVAVNVAYDKALADAYNEFGEQIGYTPITDREALTRFLQIAAQSRYRYIFLDVNFPHELTTQADSALFGRINCMRDIVVSVHRSNDGYGDYDSEEFACTPLLAPDKQAYADYRFIKGNSFSKYEFLQDGNESVALRMYHDLNHGSIAEHGAFYTDNGHLCYNTRFITLPKRILFAEKETGEIRYPYLTGHFFARHTASELAAMLDGKIIVIGDFDNDKHDSLIGPVPGPMLSYYAYRTLADGGHRVNTGLQIFMFALYLLLGYRTLSVTAVSEARRTDGRRKSLTASLPVYFMGTGVFLGIVDLIIYYIFANSYTIIIPTVVFTLLSARRRVRYIAMMLLRKSGMRRRRKVDVQLTTQS